METFSVPSEFHRKLWPVGTVAHDGPQGQAGPLTTRPRISERIARAIYDYHTQQYRIGRDVWPKYVYLGLEEAADLRDYTREICVTNDAVITGTGQFFMDAEVLTVHKPSHLAVGE